MLKKLAPGDRFKLSLFDLNRPPAAVPPSPTVPVDFVEVTGRRYKLRHPKPVPNEPDASPVEAGTHAHAYRNFLWIPWIPGKVSYVPLTLGLPVITGLMTGCWLVVFTLNGQTCFGHIGTEGGPNTANSLQVKNAWKIAVGRRMVTPVSAFNPVNYGPGGESIFGALSINRHFYTITCNRAMTSFVVAAITRAAGQQSPQFM